MIEPTAASLRRAEVFQKDVGEKTILYSPPMEAGQVPLVGRADLGPV